MAILMPVYLYDVTNAAEPPRVLVTCRNPAAAQSLAARLNAMQADGVIDGAETFTAALPRVADVEMSVEPGSSVTVRGYEVASERIAAAMPQVPAKVVDTIAPAEEPAP